MALNTESSRYIAHLNEPPKDLREAKNDIQSALIYNVQRVHRHPSSKPGVYVGGAGTIFMDWKVSTALPSLNFPVTPVSSLAAVPFSTPRSGSHASFLETSVGPATLILASELHILHGEGTIEREKDYLDKTWEGCARLLDGALQLAIHEELDEDGCEVLYGRAGLLYALLFLRSELSASARSPQELDGKPVVRSVARLCSDANVQALVNDIIERGQAGASAYGLELESDERRRGPPLMWRWHGKRYLGGAHGVAGILQMLISCPSHVLAPHWPAILGTIEWLLAIQDPLGNWPSKAGRHMPYVPGGSAASKEGKRLSVEYPNDDALVQWCHGATGILILLSSLLSRTSHSSSLSISSSLVDSLTAALKRGGELVYIRGLLRKGVGLCHGTAGSVFALLAVSDVLDRNRAPKSGDAGADPYGGSSSDTYWLVRAVHLAQLATMYQTLEQKGDMCVPDRPYSLYEGLGGVCCAWAETLARFDYGPQDGNRANSRMANRRMRGMPGYGDVLMV
ncbi:hypothetical protein AcV7_007181 [Taiwanofungus camphoratus]|nr:hypothetical protein AcV7_007181 [Antrodia cinnamomea]